MSKTVKVDSSWKGGMRVEAQARDHHVIVDQPKAGGGEDAGANPLEYLFFSIAGCLGTVASIMSRQERIDLRAFDVHIEGEYDPDFLMGRTKEGRAGFTEIRLSVHIDADLTDEEKEDFFHRVDSRCPLCDNLIGNTKILFDVN